VSGEPPNASGRQTTRSRYLGSRPFNDTEEDRARFFGRDAEGEQLYLRVLSVSLLVQFAASGVGKTSLLLASLFPRLRQKSFLPVMVRLNASDESLVDAVIRSFEEACKSQGLKLPELRKDGLWELLSTALVWRDGLLLTPVLVFDQFEEVFTLHSKVFRDELAEELGALATGVPPERLGLQQTGLAERFGARPDVKIVISLREDSLGALEEFSPAIPHLFRERLRLEALSESAARDAIAKPAQLDVKEGEEPFWAPRFEFEPAAIEEVLAYLKGKSGVIEPFTLQLLCRHVEAIAHDKSERGQGPIRLALADFAGARTFESVLKNFYRDALGKLPASVQDRAEELCEHGFLDREGRRLPLEEGQIYDQFRIDAQTLESLVQERVIRRERRLESVFYEITHDRLAESIFASRRNKAPKAELEQRQREQEQLRIARRLVRRTRVSLAAAVVALLVVLVAVGAVLYALDQQRLADTRAAEAAGSYSAALAAAKAAVETVDRYAKAGKIRTEVARSFLDAARTTFSNLPSAREESETTRVRVHLFSALAETYLALGDLKNAREAAETERSLAELLGSSGPEGPHDLSDSHNKLGEVLKGQGNLAKALNEYSESLAAMKKAAAKDPTDNQWLQDIAAIHRKIADVFEDRGDLRGALGERQESASILTQLVAKDPNNRGWRRDLAESHRDVGSTLRARGDRAHAAEELRSGIEIMAKLTAEEQDNAAWQWLLGDCQGQLGEVLQDQGQSSDALHQFHSNLTVLDRLLAKDPDNAQWRHDLAVVHNEIGSALQKKGDLEGALSETTQAEASLAELAKRDPTNLYWQRELAPSRGWVGAILLDQHEAVRALDKFLTYLAMMTDLSEKDPNNATWKSLLADAHANVGEAQRAQGELDKALKESRAALAIDAKLVAQDQENDDWQLNLVADYLRIGGVLQDGRDFPGASKEFQLALDVTNKRLVKDPGNVVWVERLSAVHHQIGAAFEDQGNMRSALKELKDSLSVMEELSARDPSNASWQRGLSVLHDDIGSTLKAQDRRSEALEEFRTERVIIRQLLEKEPDNMLWKQDLADADASIDEMLDAQSNTIEVRHRRPRHHALKSR
jgi:tetratricopeptide (TPR) repeat protein